MIALKLMDGIVSPVYHIEGGFLIYKWKNAMDAHGSRLMGDGSFGHPGQSVKMDEFESFSYNIHIVWSV